MKEKAGQLAWKKIAEEIVCPFDPEDCRLSEGFSREEKMISHNAVIFTASCNFCERKASVMGERNDNPI